MKRIATITSFLCTLLISQDKIDYDAFLLESLNEVSTIATKTKLNIDDMPAFVTILRQDKLLELGIDTVYEALELVPGVELSIESSGAKQVIFRGVKEKGKITLMVDGVTINNAYRGSIYHYLDFPIELVKRVEVIRGPGSVIYGSNAIAGIINIVTLSDNSDEEKKIFAKTGSYSTLKGGFVYSSKNDIADVKLDGYYHKNDKGVDAGPDLAGSYSKSDERLKDYSIGIQATKDNFSFNGRYKRSNSGLFYGMGNYFTPRDDNEEFINATLFAQATYENKINSDTNYRVDLGYNRYEQKIDTRFAPQYGGIMYNNNYSEQSFYTKASLNTTHFESHNIILGAEFTGAYALNTSLAVINHPLLNPTNIITPHVNRKIASIYVNDQIELINNLDMSAGLRYDHYSDFGDAFSPRLALVYKLDKKTNLKAMYSRAFRAPSWVELYSDAPGISLGNDNLKAETSDTVEAGIIHNLTSKETLKFNGYLTQIDDIIYRDSVTKRYTQAGRNRFYGAEVEYDAYWLNSLNFNLNLSYVIGKDNNNKELPQIANVLGNANLLYRFATNFTSGSLLKYVGKINRESADNRNSLDPSFVFDQSLTYRYSSFEFIATIKNLFDEDVKYISPINTYQNDYEREGRSFWVSVIWNF